MITGRILQIMSCFKSSNHTPTLCFAIEPIEVFVFLSLLVLCSIFYHLESTVQKIDIDDYNEQCYFILRSNSSKLPFHS
ncbi:hypothetical protein ACFX13_032539 [Malus domestica]